jgi:hypothetical protein
MLPPDDAKYIAEHFAGHNLTSEANMICVILQAFPLPGGFDRQQSDLLLRLSPGYPDVPPDMWWFDPPIHRGDGQPIPNADVIEHYLGRSWQRWSRHFSAGQWRSGVDSLESFIALLRKELVRSVNGSGQ